MRKIEISLFVVVVILCLLKLANVDYPLSYIILPLPVLIYVLQYLFFGVAVFNNIPIKNIFTRESYKAIDRKKRRFSRWSGVILSFTILLLFFAVQGYPGHWVDILGSLYFCLFWIIITTIYYFVRKDAFYWKILLRLFILLPAIILIYLKIVFELVFF